MFKLKNTCKGWARMQAAITGKNIYLKRESQSNAGIPKAEPLANRFAYDQYGNKFEVGDFVAYGARVSMICGVMNCKLLISNGDRVDKRSCTIIRKANGQPLKYGIFG